jgi:uncharacterized phage-associated protein
MKELILYVASKSEEDASFGAVKLNKLLFFADFWAYGNFGRPITGATYEKQKFGPVPREVKKAQEDLEAAGDIVVTERRKFYPQRTTHAKREADLSVFEDHEIRLVDEILEVFMHDYAGFVSDVSHSVSAGWQRAKMRGVISYDSVFLSTDDISEQEISRGQELAAQHGWN